MREILVLQRGWVILADVERDGQDLIGKNASVIRNWGTTKGLGQLAKDGPTATTILDRCPDIRCHELTVVLRMLAPGC